MAAVVFADPSRPSSFFTGYLVACDLTVWCQEFVVAAHAVGGYSFDVEHEPDQNCANPGFRMHGVGVATGPADGDVLVRYLVDPAEYIPLLSYLFSTDLEAVAYNGKYDYKCLRAVGLDAVPVNFCDPMLGVNLLDDNRPAGMLGLKPVVLHAFRVKLSTYEEASAGGLDTETFRRYACDDARFEWLLWERIKPRLIKEGLFKLHQKILCPASVVFADMEASGIYWDLTVARRLLHRLVVIRDDSEKTVREFVGHINLKSPTQISDRLFGDLGISTRGVKKTKGSGKTKKGSDEPGRVQYSTDAKTMARLARKYPACAALSTYRTACVLIGTYVEPLSRLALSDREGRIHPSYWLTSATGRTRCTNPNFQNLPAWLPEIFSACSIRRAVCAAPGRKLIVADLSQIELRVIAHVSRDPVLSRSYLQHRCTVCGVGESPVILHKCPSCGMKENPKILESDDAIGFYHGLDIHQQTADLVPALRGIRRHGKTSNFALVYYATAYKMHGEYPEFSKAQWQIIIDQYFAPNAYAGVRTWHGKMERLMYATGVAQDLFGRKRRISAAAIRKSPKHALNQFINFIPQASACSIGLHSMIKMRERFMDMGVWLNGVNPQNFIHDEVVLEVDEHLVCEARSVVVDCMENSLRLRVPIRTEALVVDSWGECKS